MARRQCRHGTSFLFDRAIAVLRPPSARSTLPRMSLSWLLSLPPLSLLVSFASVALAAALWRDWRARAPLSGIPTPHGWPLLGHVPSLLSRPWLAFSRFAEAHGPIYVLRLWSKPFVVISDPDLVRHVFKDSKHKYVKDQWSYEYFRCVREDETGAVAAVCLWLDRPTRPPARPRLAAHLQRRPRLRPRDARGRRVARAPRLAEARLPPRRAAPLARRL